jgi:hypothetical protein
MACRALRSLHWRFAAAAAVFLAQIPATQCLHAQTFDASTLGQPAELNATWLVKAGDDPSYASPGYDDSQWLPVDPTASIKSYFPGREPNILWYRLHVKVAPNQTGLALAEFNLSSAFEVYVNGEKLIHSGQIAPFRAYTYDAYLIRPIPDADIATGELTIAMRMYVSRLEWKDAFPGFYPMNLLIGQQTALSDRIWLTVIGTNALGWFAEIGGVGLGLVALALYLAQRRQRVYLWIFLTGLTSGVAMPLELYRLFHTLPAPWEYVYGPLQIASTIFTALMFFALLRIPFARWIQIFLALVALAQLYSTIATVNRFGSTAFGLLIQIPLVAIVLVMIIVHMRRGSREAGILLVPAIFNSLAMLIATGLFLLSLIPNMAPRVIRMQVAIFRPTLGPFTLGLGSLSGCLFELSLAIIMVLRATRTSRQQAELESELAAAQEVQQVILPDQMETVPGFQVESAYQPAQQVGGDFFQILPAGEGGLLLVIGDVAGKGLPAAMLVSVLVGAIRGVAEYTTEPAELLANLNQRLIGRVNGGFSTALAARISANGAVTMANAGHLAPYLDGREVTVPGALPLGIQADVRYETIGLQLPAGSRLTFYSDGIVEAQSAKGELFGFERSRELSRQPVTAILEAAKEFGQQDDMTVIAITRDAAVATAA